MLGPGPRLMKKKNLPGRGLTKVEKTLLYLTTHNTQNQHPCPRRDSNPLSQQESASDRAGTRIELHIYPIPTLPKYTSSPLQTVVV